MFTDNNEEKNLDTWEELIFEVVKISEPFQFFNWGGGSLDSAFGSITGAAKALAEQLEGRTDIKIIGHSRGGALVMEFMAEVAEGRLGKGKEWKGELRGAYTIDSPLDTLVQASPIPIANTRFGMSRLFFEGERFANLPQRLARQGVNVDMATFDNPEDFGFTNHAPIPGIPYFRFRAVPEGYFGWSGGPWYQYAAHGLLLHDPRVSRYIAGVRAPIAGPPTPITYH